MNITGRLLFVLAAMVFALWTLPAPAPADESMPRLVQSVSESTPVPESVLTDSGDETDEDERLHCGALPGLVAAPVPDAFPRRVALASPAVLSIGIHHQSPGQGPPA